VLLLLQKVFLTGDEIKAWGWRIPFAIGALLAVVAAIMRQELQETSYTSINAIVKAELFPTKIRATGVGLPYALTVSIFGGSAPAVALAFKNAGHETWFYFYLTAAIFISLIIYVTMRDTKKDSAMERHV
jgi:MFS family permease